MLTEAHIPEAVEAALGAKSFGARMLPLSHEDQVNVGRLIKPDVDTWRARFSQKLRETGEELLDLTRREMADIPPAARAYTLAVLIDKATALEGRSSLAGAQVNVQINNFSGSTSKEQLLAAIQGRAVPKPVEPTSPPV